jgi:hypothetical protein
MVQRQSSGQGIVAKTFTWGSDKVSRACNRVQSLQMASLSWGHHPLVCAVVPEIPDLVCAQAEMAIKRGLFIHPSCIWRWVQIYGPELNQRCPAHRKRTKQKLSPRCNLHSDQRPRPLSIPAVDSTGPTIDFLLTAKRETEAAKRFFRKNLPDPANPRVINVDKNRASPVVEELKAEGALTPTMSTVSVQVSK